MLGTVALPELMEEKLDRSSDMSSFKTAASPCIASNSVLWIQISEQRAGEAIFR